MKTIQSLKSFDFTSMGNWGSAPIPALPLAAPLPGRGKDGRGAGAPAPLIARILRKINELTF